MREIKNPILFWTTALVVLILGSVAMLQGLSQL